MIAYITAAQKSVIDEAAAAELYASNLYLHVANQLQRLGYTGAASYFRKESDSEREHYSRHAGFLNDMGSCAAVAAIPAIDEPVTSLADAVQIGYDTERALLEDYEVWCEKSTTTAKQFLLQFIEIQRKSVGEYGDLLSRLARAGGDACGILLIDKEMGSK